jgi:hypothetical protein
VRRKTAAQHVSKEHHEETETDLSAMQSGDARVRFLRKLARHTEATLEKDDLRSTSMGLRLLSQLRAGSQTRMDKMTLTHRSLTATQQDIVDKILALRRMTADSGFKTTRSQNDLLERLSADDLAAVAAALYK